METEKIEEICGNCLHWPVCYKLLSQHEGNACSSRLEYGLFRPRKELDELAALKEENERLKEGLVCPVCGGRDFHNTNTGLGLEHKDGRLFCSSECLVRAIRNEHEAALSQKLAIKEDKILQCQRRATVLVYGGECDAMSGAEVRQMLVDEFGEETVAALDQEGKHEGDTDG